MILIKGCDDIMSTPYKKLYSNLLPKFKSYKIPIMTEEEAEEFLQDYITPASVKFHTCRTDLMMRDDEKKEFVNDLTDAEIDILANCMLIEYVDANCIRVPTVLKVQLSSSDFNTFSPSNFLKELVSMQEHYISINEALLSRYAWLGMTKEQKDRLSIKRG